MAVNRLERYWEEPEAAEPIGEATIPRPGDEPLPRRNNWMNAVGTMLADHPQAMVVAAITMGVMLGWLIKRR